MRRIVVVRAGALGDFLLGVPALAALRRSFPAAHLTLAGPLPQARFALAMGLADELLSIDDPRLAPLFQGDAADVAGPPAVGDADVAVAWFSRAKTVAAALSRWGARRVLAAPPFSREIGAPHVADWLLETLAPLGVRAEPKWDTRPWLRASADGERWAADWHDAALGGAQFAVLHPGSGSGRKNWSPRSWAKVASHVVRYGRLRLVVTAGPADDRALSEITASLQDAGLGPVAVRDPDLPHLAGLISRAALYMGNDSGVTHLAAGLGAPTVAAFGPTNPSVWRPRGPRVRVLGGNVSAGLGEVPLIAEEAFWPELDRVVTATTALLQP